jgi:hypothetical protein
MDDAALVGVAEGPADIEADLRDVAIGELTRRYKLAQRRAPGELADQDRARAIVAELVQGGDPGVIEPRGGLRLAQDPLRVRPGDLLDRDLALKPLIERAVDDPHASGAEPLEDPEPPQRQLADHR